MYHIDRNHLTAVSMLHPKESHTDVHSSRCRNPVVRADAIMFLLTLAQIYSIVCKMKTLNRLHK